MPTDDIAQPKPCPHGHHRGIGCIPCTEADLLGPKDTANFRMKMATSVLVLPHIVKQRDEARAELAKLRAAVGHLAAVAEWKDQCGPDSYAQAQRDLIDAIQAATDLLPEDD